MARRDIIAIGGSAGSFEALRTIARRLPADLPAGRYTLEIGMYDGDKRSVFDGHSDHLVLGEVLVRP